ncbi:hypothetical protein FUAX_38000 [Fulvitalea axinellae]|uniref:HTH araC/xylS-type domain-containing protein n=1 Tax=Fulvitalea axinellae TaxID=1182444 RepID=A0AAU9CMA4_9BACT|nr:hypothetical protein FUAX_38000 [Fulvitalea axinellae]
MRISVKNIVFALMAILLSLGFSAKGQRVKPVYANDTTLVFNGNERLRLGSFEAGNNDDFSLSLWIKPEELDGKFSPIIGFDSAYYLQINPKRGLHLNLFLKGDLFADSAFVAQGAWQHVALTKKGRTFSLYKDGELDLRYLFKHKELKANPEKLLVGSNCYDQYFTGAIRTVNYFDEALDHQSVKELFRRQSPALDLSEGLIFSSSLSRPSFLKRLFAESKLDFQNVSWTSDSVKDESALFDGKSAFAQGPLLHIDHQFTVSAWFKPLVTGSYGGLIGLENIFSLKQNSRNIYLTLPKTKDLSVKEAQFRTNEWQHIAISFESNKKAEFYIDGKHVGTHDLKGMTVIPGEAKITFGKNLWKEYFQGHISDVAIWNRILSESEIRKVHMEGIPELHTKTKWKALPIILLSLLLLGIVVFIFSKKKNQAENTQSEINQENEDPKERIQRQALALIREHIEKELDNPDLKVASLARGVGMSKSKMFNIIKEQTGMASSAYLRSVRLEKAAEMLLHTDAQVGDIMDRTGFSSRSYFSKCFQERYQCKPSAYRKANLEVPR